jgi:putative phage-type endonuclease
MPRLSDEQMAERALGLGASDVATIAGVNPWRSAFELYLEKIGELDPDARLDDAARGRFERGHRLEDVALEWDRDISGEPFERVNRTIWHPRLPFLYCHPDARRRPWSRTRRLIEVKTAARKWTEVPRHVEAQVAAQMACTGADSVDIVVLGFDGPPTRFLVKRDEQLITALEGLATAFWDRVQRRDPPPMDGSAGASSWLDRRWREEPERLATPEERTLIATYLSHKRSIVEAQAQVDRIGNILKFGLEGNRVNAPGVGRITWMAPNEVKTPRWKDIASALRGELEEEAWAAIVEEHTTVQERGGWLRVNPDERGD